MVESLSEGLTLSLIEHNINVFLQLNEYEKIIIDQNNKVEIDNRYLQSLRRKLDWWIWSCESSRQSTLKIIKETYNSLKNHKDYYYLNLNKIQQSLTNLKEKLSLTYSNYPDIINLINELKTFYNQPVTSNYEHLPPLYMLYVCFFNINNQTNYTINN